MKLYHACLVKIEKPRMLESSVLRTVDFGNGFYTTTDYEQAKRWVKIRQTRQGKQTGYISIYETDDNLLTKKDLKILVFTSATKEWLQFVMRNRMDALADHEYDLVAGPVANDRVYATLTLFEAELLDIEETIRRLKTYTLVNQILFHTEKALNELHYTGSEAVE